MAMSDSFVAPSQTVGTPADMVTPSSLINVANVGPSPILLPGITIFAPATGQAYGLPQALTWNIGTIGNTTSADEMFMESGIIVA